MMMYDFCLAWNWKFDADFAALIEKACRLHGVSLLQITPENILDILPSLTNHQTAFQVFLDRASDADTRFFPIVQWAKEQGVNQINPSEKAVQSWDKTTMHLILIDAGLYAPYTIILPPYKEQPVIAPVDLSPLGQPFIIKPSHGGGGDGVIMDATSFAQVLAARQEYPADKYLLQFHIVPALLNSRPAWFRVVYCAGKVYPCWWDTKTHVYAPVTALEEQQYALHRLYDVTAAIARLCELEMFSTEIAFTPNGLFVVVDYVNDLIDLRLQSKAEDGVPDALAEDLVDQLILMVKRRIYGESAVTSMKIADWRRVNTPDIPRLPPLNPSQGAENIFD